MENILVSDHIHSKRICKDFKIKNLGKHHELYLISDKLLSADVFENFRKKCLKIYQLDRAKFLLASGLAWQVALKKIESKYS